MYRLPVCVCLIRRMCPCDLTFHITTLARVGRAHARLAGLPPPSKCPAPPSSRTLPNPLQSRDKQKWLPPAPPDAPVTVTCILPHTPAWAFSRMCPSLLRGAAWEVSPEREPCPSPAATRVVPCPQPSRRLPRTVWGAPSQGPNPTLPRPGLPSTLCFRVNTPPVSGSHQTELLEDARPQVEGSLHRSGEATWGSLGSGLLPEEPVLEQAHLGV